MKKEKIERIYHRNGRVFQEVPFVGGKINGPIREWHKNGVLAKEVPMKDGVRDGVCKQWNDKGELLGTFEMTMGIGVSKEWYPNGQLAFEASIVNESFTGRLRRWNEEGALVQENFFLKNKKVSPEEYARACRTDSSLPTYENGAEEPVLARANHRRGGGHERLIARLLSSVTANAMEWLKASTPGTTRTLGEMNAAKSISLVRALQEAGAVDVFAVDIDEDPKGNQHADKLVVVMPTNQKDRQQIRAKCTQKKLVISPENETGHSHLAIFLG